MIKINVSLLLRALGLVIAFAGLVLIVFSLVTAHNDLVMYKVNFDAVARQNADLVKKNASLEAQLKALKVVPTAVPVKKLVK